LIISHRHRFIFIKTAKVGGSSLEIALSKYCGPQDVLTSLESKDEQLRTARGFAGPRNDAKALIELRPADIAKAIVRRAYPLKYYNHIDARSVRDLVGPKVWDSYTKFTVVRNPWQRALSNYYWDQLQPAAFKTRSFLEYLLKKPQEVSKNWPIYTIDDEVAVDLIVKYEELETGLAALADRVGIDDDIYALMKTIRAKAGVREIVGKTSDSEAQRRQATDLIALLGCREIEHFGYRPPQDFLSWAPRGSIRPLVGQGRSMQLR